MIKGVFADAGERLGHRDADKVGATTKGTVADAGQQGARCRQWNTEECLKIRHIFGILFGSRAMC